ncbi:YAP-binding/ALF4/Glomulin [Pseudomassariella vexata]|uniref:YAP-binding/ALF4/Glomulin n=1 Tax=Pseudomassariella vexata TaxID=1141098 RepID=A0A1Y2DJ30_9PEZI|nr:YAP-binding/ALF4/Glomulin [Pseudomassariella vexata]ORY59239.1 YAP-binding/ALF4/Glomulin [Pseudomassariella vexata]
MPELSESIAAIKQGAKEDRFTYLTILQYHVKSPEILPALNDVLEQDAQLAEEIGWDLVQMLLGIPGSETCLETVARLGNPREVIIKVMEALDGLTEAAGDEEAATTPDVSARFIVLLGMVAILHRRIKTKYPSRFLGPSLVKVFEAYQPTPEMTAAVINLVRSLSGRKRPALPTRKSSINVTNLDQDGDNSKNAPDPEAEQEEPTEDKMQEKLLQAFVTCILQRYVNQNEMQWSARLLEYYHPEKLVPGKKTIAQAFNEDGPLHQRDAVIGQLVALADDLGLTKLSDSFIAYMYENVTIVDPLAAFEDFSSPEDIHLSPGGAVCLIAYWVFSSEVFDADNPQPGMYIFPDHVTLLERFLGTEAQVEIGSSPGIADALLAIGLGLQHKGLIKRGTDTNFMAYHHHLTLISVFHPDIQIRNAATSFAGTILHSDPDDQNRLDILEDLLENCMFASLKACAVVWLKEELIAARKGNATNQFSSPDVIDRLQYFVFPATSAVKDMGEEELLDYWAQNSLFLLQVANFAFFLFSEGCRGLVPAGMRSAVEQRFAEPLVGAAERLLKRAKGQGGLGGLGEKDTMGVSILAERLKGLPLQ